MRGTPAWLGLIWIALLCACSETGPDPERTERGVSSHSLLELDGVLLKSRTKAGDPVSLRARHLVHAKRRSASGVFVYHSFSEFLLDDVLVEAERDQHAGFSRIVLDLLDRIEVLGGDSGAAPVRERAEQAPDGPTPSRALFRNFQFVERSDAGELELRASRARLNFDSGMLVLEGDVRLRSARGERLEAEQAVLAPDDNGLFMPLGNRWDGRLTADAVFLVAAPDGRLSASQGLPSRSYDDLLERRERVVLTHLAERAPAGLRPFMAAILGQLSRPDATK